MSHSKKVRRRLAKAPPVPHSNVALMSQDVVTYEEQRDKEGNVETVRVVSRQLTPFKWPVNRATRRGLKAGTRTSRFGRGLVRQAGGGL